MNLYRFQFSKKNCCGNFFSMIGNKMKVYIVRHGVTDACGLVSVDNIKPNKDVPLSTTGVEQVRAILDILPKTITKIFTSPTIRTIETSQIIADYCTTNPEIIQDLRIKNKVVVMDSSYTINITSFLEDLSTYQDKEVVLVTHGRIIKMMHSLLNLGKIDCEFMDKLELNYASVFLMERISNEFVFPDWNFSK